jgi:deoxyribonuclease V
VPKLSQRLYFTTPTDIIRSVKIEKLHTWQVTIPQAVDLQRRLASRVSRSGKLARPRFIAGVDISVSRALGTATAAVVVLRYPDLKVVETKIINEKIEFPYVPGLLSFREAPLTLAVCEGLDITPDLFLVDGQGIAHPRRFGLASHLGLFLNTPTIGCAKSLLCGECEEPGNEPGRYSEIRDGDETIGAALRTRAGIRPVYVSIGHKIDLPAAIHWVRECCRGYRLPEPARLAHQAAGGNLARGKSIVR